MNFRSFVDLVRECSLKNKFDKAAQEINTAVNAFDHQTLIDIVKEIGTIPECIEASSTQEKLYSKPLIVYWRDVLLNWAYLLLL